MDKNKNKKKKCQLKCKTCQNYDKPLDYCKVKEIENCSKAATQTDFSTCQEYIINEKLVMF